MLGLGCQHITREALAAAVTAGIELVDTAEAYGTEAIVGELAQSCMIVTKGGLGPDWIVDGRAKRLADSARASLEKLRRIDLYLLHAVDPKVPIATSVRALAKLRDDSVVRAIGVSNVTIAQLEAACAVTKIDAVEIELSLAKLDRYFIEWCLTRGIAVLAQRPFGGAAGVKKLLRDPLLKELGHPPDVALAYLRSLGITPLPGATRVETAVACARNVELSPEAIRAITDRFGGATRAPKRDGEVVLIMGMPGSGKSTLAARFTDYARLNRDELGGTLKGLAQRLDALLATESRVVLDNTYASRLSRAQVIRVAQKHGIAVRCLVLDTSLEDAQRNVAQRIVEKYGRLLEPKELLAEAQVPPSAQFRFRRQLEPPREDEGMTIEHVPFVREPRGTQVGTIVELDGIIWKGRPRSKIELLPGARELLASCSGVVCATTWQPESFDPSIDDQLRALVGDIHIARCTHPAGPPICWCRKPLPGMALLLAHQHDLDLSRSIHIGRGPADRGFAERAGMQFRDIVT
ncbi:MAG: aldo/keto reductase [Kofleriaceae bacterium]